jgi:hypothetical protein
VFITHVSPSFGVSQFCAFLSLIAEKIAMNDTEREALKTILFALFLESPKRKVLQSLGRFEKTGKKKSDNQIRKYKLGHQAGDTQNGK